MEFRWLLYYAVIFGVMFKKEYCTATLSLMPMSESVYACPAEDVNITCLTNGTYFIWEVFGLTTVINRGSSGVPSSLSPGVFLNRVVNETILSSTLTISPESMINSTFIACMSDDQIVNITFHRVSFVAPVLFHLESIIIDSPNKRNVTLSWSPTGKFQSYVLSCYPSYCSTKTINNSNSTEIVLTSLNEATVQLTAIDRCENDTAQLNLRVLAAIPTSTYSAEVTSQDETAPTYPAELTLRSETAPSGATDVQEFSNRNVSLTVGLIIGFLILISMAMGITIWIICRLKRRKQAPGQMVDDVPEYSTTSHNASTSAEPDVYSHLNLQQFNNNLSGSRRTNNIVYTDVEKKGGIKDDDYSGIHRMNDNSVIYSGVHTSNFDLNMDLNILLIQLSSIANHWKDYGRVVGVPADVLGSIDSMDGASHDKLVEVLDYWFFMCKPSLPTWKNVAEGLTGIGYNSLANEIMKVYATGKLPIQFNENDEFLETVSDNVPPPLPPKSGNTEYANGQKLPIGYPSNVSKSVESKFDSISDVDFNDIPKVPPRPPKY